MGNRILRFFSLIACWVWNWKCKFTSFFLIFCFVRWVLAYCSLSFSFIGLSLDIFFWICFIFSAFLLTLLSTDLCSLAIQQHIHVYIFHIIWLYSVLIFGVSFCWMIPRIGMCFMYDVACCCCLFHSSFDSLNLFQWQRKVNAGQLPIYEPAIRRHII